MTAKSLLMVFLAGASGILFAKFVTPKVLSIGAVPDAIKKQGAAVETGFTAVGAVVTFGVLRGLLGA